MTARNDLVGRRFGNLIAIAISGRTKDMRCIWKCRCDCGNEKDVSRGELLQGKTISCGCVWRAKIAKGNPIHGQFGTSTYNSWSGMIARCCDSNNPAYKNYGARGIRVCDRWRDFRNFLADMGEKPTGTTIERKNNNSNYEESNCTWATREQQANNTRANRWLTIDGESRTIAQWSKLSGINYETIRGRIKRGLSPKEAIQ